MDEAASSISSGVAPPSAVGRGMFMNKELVVVVVAVVVAMTVHELW